MREIMTVTKGLLGGFVMLATCSASAMADDAVDGHWKPPPAGTLLEYNYGESCLVISVEEDRYFCKGDRTHRVQDVTWSVYKGMEPDISVNDGSSIPVDSRAIDKLFPLEVGNTTIVSLRVGGDVWKTKYKVTSFKTIETILGPRSVFGISYIRSNRKYGYKAKGWGYLDAELGFYHSGRHIDVEPNERTLNWRLFTLELPADDVKH